MLHPTKRCRGENVGVDDILVGLNVVGTLVGLVIDGTCDKKGRRNFNVEILSLCLTAFVSHIKPSKMS